MYRVLISAPYMHAERDKVEALLAPHALDVTWACGDERLEEDELLSVIAPFHGIICGDDQLTPRVYDAAHNLKVVVKWGTGIDSINRDEAERRGIQVRRTVGAFTDPVADTTLAYILAFARGVITNDNIVKSGRWEKPTGFALCEKTIGIIGFGHIGEAVSKRLAPFRARVLTTDIAAARRDVATSQRVEVVSPSALFGEADFITLHCDLNPTSRQLLDTAAFAAMHKRPFIINTARGPLINESALIEALRAGRVQGAALDVFEEEPLHKHSPLLAMGNVILACHNSNSSPAHWDRVHRNSIEMLVDGLVNGA
jgi:phosphoglycerate dehydrogenase-like enzyme